MTVVATAVASFENETAATTFRVVEPDETLNLDAVGEEKTEFTNEDEFWFWVQHADGLTINRIECAGQPGAMITAHGTVRRSRTSDLIFTGLDAVELPYIPAAMPQVSWKGAPGGSASLEGRNLNFSQNTPCECTVTIPIEVHLFCLHPGHENGAIVVYFDEEENK